MDHKREEETELKFPENPVSCTPKQPDPITRSTKLPRPRCGNLLKNPDPIKNISLNRCSGCQKKVGLTGFRCRCGELFCTEHRYTDRHDCSYDYKAAGREAIARDNPVVRPAKLVKV